MNLMAVETSHVTMVMRWASASQFSEDEHGQRERIADVALLRQYGLPPFLFVYI